MLNKKTLIIVLTILGLSACVPADEAEPLDTQSKWGDMTWGQSSWATKDVK